MSTVVRCSTNLSVGLCASRDTQLVRFSQARIVLNLSGVFPGVDLQLRAAGLHSVGRGWCGRHGARGHLVAPRHHWGRPGGRRGGLPARAEGDVARAVRHEGAGPAAGQEGQGASAGRHVQPGRLRSPRGGTVDLVRDVTLIVTTLCELSGLSGHVNKVRNMIKLS